MLATIAKTFGVSQLIENKKDKVFCDTVLGLDFSFDTTRLKK